MVHQSATDAVLAVIDEVHGEPTLAPDLGQPVAFSDAV